MATIYKDGKVISRGKNLRNIHDRARRLRALTRLRVEGRMLYVQFRDGSHTQVEFADAGVLADYVRQRIKRHGIRYVQGY